MKCVLFEAINKELRRDTITMFVKVLWKIVLFNIVEVTEPSRRRLTLKTDRL